MERVALVTGANRGIGYASCKALAKKGFKVILTSRDKIKGEKAVKSLEGLNVLYHQLDVTDDKSVDNLVKFVEKTFGRLDVLINNAGIMMHSDSNNPNALNGDAEILKKTLDTNTCGPFRMCKAFIPLMMKNNYGRIVNISSGMGQLSEMNSMWPEYRISKTALNAVTKVFASETSGSNILVNSMCPGWVKTDMGGPNAQREPEVAVETVLWLAALPDDGATGCFFRDKKLIGW